MSSQREMFPRDDFRPHRVLTLRTYVYLRPDGKCVHSNAGYGFVGQEYEHDDPKWQPGADWPYEVIDLRKPKQP
jgi:hypothetical protein